MWFLQGSVKSGVLGEIGVNLADYAEAFKPYSVSLPLKAPNAETVLHVSNFDFRKQSPLFYLLLLEAIEIIPDKFLWSVLLSSCD